MEILMFQKQAETLCKRQKWGKRAGLLAKLKANASRPAITSLFLSNVRALDDKLDLLRLKCQDELQECCVMVLVETWLSSSMPDSGFQLDGRIFFCSDQNQLSGKTRGGGLGIYVHKGWCTNCSVVGSHCSEAVEHLTIKCRPHYLPREFTAVFTVAV